MVSQPSARRGLSLALAVAASVVLFAASFFAVPASAARLESFAAARAATGASFADGSSGHAHAVSSVARVVEDKTHPRSFNAYHTDSNLADIQWASKDVLFLLTFDSHCYRSINGGRSWEDQQARMNATGVRIRQVRISPSQPGTVFFLGEHGHHMATRDMGETYYPIIFPLVEVRLHPTEPWMLSAVMTPGCGRAAHPSDDLIYPDYALRERVRATCFKQLYLTRDFGKTWRHLYDYVVQYDWSPKGKEAVTTGPKKRRGKNKPVEVIYATAHADQTGNQVFGKWSLDVNLIVSYDFFATEPDVLVAHGNRFLFGENNYFFVAAGDVGESSTSVRLWVSKTASVDKEGSFRQALLPVSLTEHSYTILDASEGTVFLHVNHNPFHDNAKSGHIYVSDSTGTQFSIALAYNHRSQSGRCDFAKLEGLEGVFLANFVDVEDSTVTGGGDADALATSEEDRDAWHRAGGTRMAAPLRLNTVISYNKGAMWEYLKAPEYDADGNLYNCHASDGCHLHLHGVTQGYGPFYSVASATGLILATGTVGSHLNSIPGLINTYFSRDGGLNWEEIAKGSHIYEIGDHGGLIVMATDQAPTQYLYYSWNQGKTFHKYRFTNAPIVVENIITEPSSTSQHFIVYGSAEALGSSPDSPRAGSGVGAVVYVDFEVLRTRSCQGIDAAGSEHSDFELWSPNDGRSDGACLMGHTVTYVRRKQNAECFIPAAAQKPRLVSNCACTEADFECDAGYVRDVTTKQCVPDADAEGVMLDAAEESKRRCDTQSFYRVTKGYRRVPGNTCLGGQEWEALIVPCPSGWLSASHSPAVLLLFVFLVAFAAIILFRLDAADEWIRSVKARLGIAQGYFNINKPGSLPASMVDEDDDEHGDPLYLGDSDFDSARALDAKEIRALRAAHGNAGGAAAAGTVAAGANATRHAAHPQQHGAGGGVGGGDLSSLESDSDVGRLAATRHHLMSSAPPAAAQQQQQQQQLHPALAARAASGNGAAAPARPAAVPSLQPPPQE